ncbi:MAG TPA: trypsin-like peptidase domain-containing protein, partial [Gemmatimonadaceae bacterium]|nr:trypsin-like peptidase domain-containing protein [Gemmatimonadaceae bacterium]
PGMGSGPQSDDPAPRGGGIASGSGFIVSTDGYILTNNHVVDGASEVTVRLLDRREFKAKVVGRDPNTDVAVIKINANNLTAAPLGDSDASRVGEWVLAVGNPLGENLTFTVTQGIISAKGRALQLPGQSNQTIQDFIQTDAAINPGNSGGPLVNALGQVIGVNSSIYSPSGGNVGLGFAIPIDRAKRVSDDLLAHGKVRKAWIGVKMDYPEQTSLSRNALNAGAPIREVVPGSPAAAAGLKVGDVLLRASDRVLHNAYDWDAELLEAHVDDVIPLLVRRDGKDVQMEVKVADFPEVTAQRVTVLRDLQLISVTPAIRAERNIKSNHGALIATVSSSVTSSLGIQAGDVIVQINNVPVTDAQQAKRVLESLAGSGAARMVVERNGTMLYTDFSIR